MTKTRAEVAEKDTWNLEGLYKNDDAWLAGYNKLNKDITIISRYQGKLAASAAGLKAALTAKMELELQLEALASYAFMRLQEDLGDNRHNTNFLQVQSLLANYSALASYFAPELQAIDSEVMQGYLAGTELKEYTIYLNKILRNKEHILSAKEEALLAPLEELFSTATGTFSALTDADMNFGEVEGRPLTQSSFTVFLKDSNRHIREKAYKQFYGQYNNYKNTISSLYGGSVRQDIYSARTRNFNSSLEAALFPDNVPVAVYDNLVKAVNNGLPTLHKYYDIRKKMLGVNELRHYDVYAPLLPEARSQKISWEEGVNLICEALKPLGDDYIKVMRHGLLDGRWSDRYENKGKRSGAFSNGSYTGEPYILMNYKDEDIRALFTLAHEAGHSMHSYYSVKSNPFQHYNYTIFEAEVASTFNEALLFDYLMKSSKDEQLKQVLIGERIGDITATLFRQTMFAEYEQLVHARAEAGEAASLTLFREIYDGLLKKYFGPQLIFEETSSLEALRIPHFYRAFYVYKYATGISASLALSKMVLEGGAAEREQYLSFLKSGGSRFPIDSLKLAGVDMASEAPVADAIKVYAGLLEQLKG
ncbi:MAG: oligoendopeptidase F [Spirochaetaceae bacterium]|nr:oligoendopeptidase F [Spirochaetaceae bacterium]